MACLRPLEPLHDRLRGQVSIITGAAGYIGLETVRRFLLEGSKVTMVDNDAEKLASARESLILAFPDIHECVLSVQADVTSEKDVQAFVAQTVKHFGRLDCAFLCAGMSYSSTPLLETPAILYDKIMEVNCRSGESTLRFVLQALHMLLSKRFLKVAYSNYDLLHCLNYVSSDSSTTPNPLCKSLLKGEYFVNIQDLSDSMP